jgi:hypothetical protein
MRLQKKLKVIQKTAQRILMRLALTRENVKYRNRVGSTFSGKWRNKMCLQEPRKKTMQPGIRI